MLFQPRPKGIEGKTLKIKCWTAVLRNEGRVSSTTWCGRRMTGELFYKFFSIRRGQQLQDAFPGAAVH
ncbi:MAG: hypothetical protein CVU40_17200 [Chloroflexi bacterium HGW-Chloroflexi-2]|jgi:hypothetical protein|nr:MAG: hypothetical protein CVU40_17200 [Chloroflexi bacterium HGW-Chloroflexi-2]